MDLCRNKIEENRQVLLRLNRDTVLYHIRNNAYIAHDMAKDAASKEHARHIVADICEEGNIDRVNSILTLAHAEVVEMLYPYTKQEVVSETILNDIEEPDAYDITLIVPAKMSRSSIKYISRLAEEYMVCRVLAEWLSRTDSQEASIWQNFADTAKIKISEARFHGNYTFTRKSGPF